jgi:hypothetical protein
MNLTKYIKLLVPRSLFGQSFQAIVAGTATKKSSTKRSPTKCYRVDPTKDIKDGKILVDPETGRSVSETLTQQAIEDANGDLELAMALQGRPAESPGILPGDVQQGVLIAAMVIGSLISLALMGYSIYIFRSVFKATGLLTEAAKASLPYVLFLGFGGIFLAMVSWYFAKSK